MRAADGTLILGCVAGVAVAQTTPAGARIATRRQPGKSDAGRRSAKQNAANEALASCLASGRSRTHMSKQEWGRACRRVADRLRNLTVK